MDVLVPILCLAIVVFLALAALVVLTLNSGDKKESQSASNQSVNKRNTGWQSWVLFIGIALVLALWTIWGALFFLAVVWLMRQSPGPDSSFSVGDNEKKTARRVYTWLFWSPILTVPFFLSAILNAYDGSTNELVFAALMPLIIHTPMLLGLTSKSAFVYRHTQQGILLIALRAGMASLAVSMGRSPEDGLWVFLLGNGSLWLFGSIWGWNQIQRGECWWMKQRGETIVTVSAEPVESFAPEKHIARSREFIGLSKKDDAKKHALAAFRDGDREVRLDAVKILETLDEVEEF